MTRLTVTTTVAVLALVVPAPTANRPSASDMTASIVSVPASADTPELTATEPARAAHPHGTRIRASRDPNRPTATPQMTLYPDGRAYRERLDEALERFDRAGLMLPDLHIRFSDSDDACQGHLGLFDRKSTPWRVNVCSDLEFVLTHELAHAWAAANLEDADRAAYTEYRELPAWNAPDLHWRKRGTEDAAFVIQQVLMVKHIRPDWSIWIERLAAYEQLTGQHPPTALGAANGHTDQDHPSHNVPEPR